MQLTVTTPSLLFPAISLLLLAYTNRFVTLTRVIRDLARMKDEDNGDLIRRQIHSLRLRVQLIRGMQSLGVLSFVLCTMSMLIIFFGIPHLGEGLFGLALLMLMGSLLVSLYEVHISTRAINFEIERLERPVASNSV